MADTDVGKKCHVNSDHGTHIGFVADYVAGRDGGDHLIWFAPNQASLAAGGSSYGESAWLVEGTGPGTFQLV